MAAKHGAQGTFLVEIALGCALLLVSILLAVASSSLTVRLPSSQASHHNSPLTDSVSHEISCRPGPDEEHANNCMFDEMMNGWVPQVCYNERLAKEALRNDTNLALLGGAGPFPWYRDLDFKIPLPSASLSEYLRKDIGNMTAYTWEKWHVAHCLYVWRLGLDVMTRVSRGEKDIYVSSRVLSADHVNHCNRVIADQDHRVNAKAIVTFGYHPCVRIL